ncbi:hypothetical protein QAD02_007349 [Eretmocerus hayati]|uniref:Uncharacterized protein n=1 Tax=Eretmocerus hayati TaxID=131215 RepID=A0ACC2N3G0_9HYME|nr:hypothetical protein QAD02_007349 [Eretmocerus hayati]
MSPANRFKNTRRRLAFRGEGGVCSNKDYQCLAGKRKEERRSLHKGVRNIVKQNFTEELRKNLEKGDNNIISQLSQAGLIIEKKGALVAHMYEMQGSIGELREGIWGRREEFIARIKTKNEKEMSELAAIISDLEMTENREDQGQAEIENIEREHPSAWDCEQIRSNGIRS